jgi:predicted RNase H-like HicB family nuclease
MRNQFTAVYRKSGEWWAAYVQELPGAHTQGATLDEARENLREAVTLILEVNRELAEQELEGVDAIREELTVATA